MTIRMNQNRVDLDRKQLERATLKDSSNILISASSGSAYTINTNNGNSFYITLTNDCAFTFATSIESGVHTSFELFLKQDATGGRTATWPAGVVWVDGTAPVLNADSDEFTLLKFQTIDGGSTWFGSYSGGIPDPDFVEEIGPNFPASGWGSFVVEHGLGVAPNIVRLWAECTASVLGYSAGERIHLPGNWVYAIGGITFSVTDTEINFQKSGTLQMHRKDANDMFTLNGRSDFKLVVTVWK